MDKTDNTILEQCTCRTPGEDDGDTTCWQHHDCQRGDCTHQDGADDEPFERENDCY